MNGRKLNVMVVDDSSITLKKLTKMLEELGHKVTCSAKTGTDAVTAYRAEKPDLVTMDITMPDMDGIEATRRILAEDGDALIVMVTSHGQEQMVMDAIDAGAKGYVLKPVKSERLQETIDKIVEKFLS
ncbi:MAG: response regulator [Desulfovibrionaceae bacterium]|jgi:two-component system chemotaxis response regulator CheY|nr:response regulator [Desulfovibrionaceae bacterium]